MDPETPETPEGGTQDVDPETLYSSMWTLRLLKEEMDFFDTGPRHWNWHIPKGLELVDMCEKGLELAYYMF